MTNKKSLSYPRACAGRAVRAMLGSSLVLSCALSMAFCTRSPASTPVSPPAVSTAAAPRTSLVMIEPCADAPVEESVCSLPAE